MYIEDIQQAINDYKTAIKENWDLDQLTKHRMGMGLCNYFHKTKSNDFNYIWSQIPKEDYFSVLFDFPCCVKEECIFLTLHVRLVFLKTFLKKYNELKSRSKSRSNKKP